MTIPGIDVSKYQGLIYWPNVAADGRQFAFSRSGDGLVPDGLFRQNYDGSESVGLIRGSYHFFRCGISPESQAALVVSQLGGKLLPGDLPPVVDAETFNGHAPAELPNAIGRFAAELNSQLGRAPILYTSTGFWNRLPPSDLDGLLDLWVAAWYVSAPTLPRGWTAWKFWQSTNRELVSGINGPDDGDLFNGTLEELQAYAGGQAPDDVVPPTIPECTGGWRIMPNADVRTHPQVGPRAVALLHQWRSQYDDATAHAGTVSLQEMAGNLLAKYVFCWHPVDSINPTPGGHSGVTVYECMGYAPLAA